MGALGGGGLNQTFRRFNTYEASFDRSVNPTQAQGGCPDFDVAIDEVDLGGGAEIPQQFSLVSGRNCAVPSASGKGTGFTGFDVDLYIRYDILPWLFIHTGFNIGIIPPLVYRIKVQYRGEQTLLANNLMSGSTLVPSISGTLQIDSVAKISHSIRQYYIPLFVGINFYNSEKSRLYSLFGFTYNYTKYRKTSSATQEAIQEVAGNITTVAPDYQDVANDIIFNGIGLVFGLGGSYEVGYNISIFTECRWKWAGGLIENVQGTKGEDGLSYASNTLAVKVVENTSAGGTAQVLQNEDYPLGGITVNGVNLIDFRWFVGVSYRLSALY